MGPQGWLLCDKVARAATPAVCAMFRTAKQMKEDGVDRAGGA